VRNHGTRVELVRMRPHDHIGWVYAGPAAFAALARPFLEEGASRNERLLFVVEDPGAAEFSELVGVFDPEVLQVLSLVEVYGPSGVVDATRQRATFVGALNDALDQGYAGIRVAADNTTLVSSAERLEAWIRWELMADRMMAESRIIGLCGFDRERVAIDRLRHLATLHPLSSAAEPRPQFLLFAEEDGLYIEGEVDSFAVEHVWLALEVLPPKTRVVLDMTRAHLRGKTARASLGRLADAGVEVTVIGVPELAELN